MYPSSGAFYRGRARFGQRRQYFRGRGGFKGFSRGRKVVSRKGGAGSRGVRRRRVAGASVGKALQAFRTQQVLRYAITDYSTLKIEAQTKGWIFVTAGFAGDLASVLNNVTLMQTGSVGPFEISGGGTRNQWVGNQLIQYCALRDFRNKTCLRNSASYPLKLRVITWVCRKAIPVEGSSWYDGTLDTLMSTGFSTTDATAADYNPDSSLQNNARMNWTDVDSTPFANPVWVRSFRAIKVKNYTLQPWASTCEAVHILKKRPGWVYENGNADDDSFLGIVRDGGITSVVKTIEIVGDLVNDQEEFPSVRTYNSPGVVTISTTTSFEAASPGAAATNYTYDATIDELNGASTELRTGQTFNYMFPGSSGTSQQGYSSVAGAITSGI